MNLNNTEDYTEIRKQPISFNNFSRGSLTGTKRGCKVQRQAISPLNLNELRKQLEEDLHSSFEEKAAEHLVIEDKKPIITTNNTKEDSFDLNFSALSLNTPVKEKKPTAKPDKQAPILKKEDHRFVTPNVTAKWNSGINSTASSTRKAVFTTPICPIPSRNTATPQSRFVPKPLSVAKLPVCKEEDNNKENYVPLDISGIHSISGDVSHSSDYNFGKISVKNVEYLILGELGKGGSSEVFHCYNALNKSYYAIKSVSLSNPETATGYLNEVKVLERLQHCDRIIKMFDFEILQSEKRLLMVLEKGSEDLATILKELAAKSDHVPVYVLIFYWMEMLYAVKQIHAHGIIHSDLKPANFIRTFDGGLKLIDFGIASCVDGDKTSVIKTTQEGSCNYISPEALTQDQSSTSPGRNAKFKINFKSDVWSLGCILYQLVYRKTPFHHIKHIWKKLMTILDPNYVIEYPPADWVSPKIIATIKKCLNHDVKKRPSIDELILEYEEMLKHI